ncbi:TonB-dependent receptor [Sphingosinicellaceae bacterium]|nr:TonB-dependent receptor [Sphingosinicellaceae bacterium]
MRFELPAGSLGAALVALGTQAGIGIGVSDPALAALPVRGWSGSATAAGALGHLLQGLPARAIAIDGQTWRIVPRAPPRPALRRAAPTLTDTGPAPDLGEIIITASKRETPLDTYPGTAFVIGGAALDANPHGGSDRVVAALPALSSTHLGPGRNKLFIRGVADSSFNGPTQATVGQYLGDVRLTYSAPDPNLELVDVSAVEVLEGPQGTLYGAGSIGGILRIVPEPVQLDTIAGSLAVGAATTAHGDPSGDGSAVLNLPLVNGVLGIRAVAYGAIDGGYIDDLERGRRNVNRNTTRGARLAVRYEPGEWTIDAGGVVQDINSEDGQYAERGLPRLTRRTALAQPFDNDYRLGQFVISRSWGKTKLVSASGIVDHDVTASYDFTPTGGPLTIFTQDNRILLLSNETRLSHTGSDGQGWLIGASFIRNDERLTRNLGPVEAPVRIIGVRNIVNEGAAYGEGTVGLGHRLLLTVGGRVSYDRLVGKTLDRIADNDFESGRTELRFLPSAALAWRPLDGLLVFARYQQGFRPGGVSVATGGVTGGNEVQRFLADRIQTAETGLRYDPDDRNWNLAATLSYARWRSIQADLVDTSGLPYSTNIGTGRIFGLELHGSWQPVPSLRLEAALFSNDTRLVSPDTSNGAAPGDQLPNIAELGSRAAVHWTRALSGDTKLLVDASARYVGRSRLGVGPTLDIPQGRYLDTAASLRLERGRYGVSLLATNLFDTAGNRFAFGDPFGVTSRLQETPLQPRTFRLGLDARF